MSQEELGEAINYSREQIGRYERGEVIPDNKTLALFARLFGTTVDFIIGETDIVDPVEYESYLEDIGLDAISEDLAAQEDQTVLYRNLFETCGFTYEYVGGTAEYDFATHPYDGPHRLQDKGNTFCPLYLTDEELSNLISKLTEYALFECFCISKRRENGNH